MRDTRCVPAQDELIAGQQLSELSGENAIAPLNESAEYDSLDAAVTAARYQAKASAIGAAATNYVNQMRGVFSPAGLCLESNTSNAQWRSCWRLQSIGHGEDQLTVDEGDVQTTANRVTISHTISTPDRSAIPNPASQIVTEWFNNSPGGLEHGFTLAERLSESTATLRLTIAVDGDLTAQADPDGQTLRLVNRQGEAILNYEKLKVWDADGVEIAARMTTQNSTVILDVEDATAKYPLIIDPTFFASAKLVASDGATNDNFGQSVAVSGDTVIVGATGDTIGGNANQGSAYIFIRGTNGLWTQQRKLTAADGDTYHIFGSSVAITGDTVVVGAPGANVDQGSAYVYVRSGTTWSLQQKLLANDGAASDRFGNSVGIAGDSIIVGAFCNSIGGNNNQGSAYVFVRDGSAWTQQQRLTAADGDSVDNFGGSVAIGGNTAIVGADSDDIGTAGNQGSAYIFTRSGTNWTEQQKLLAGDGAADDRFGSSVDIAINTDSVIVGAPANDIGVDGDRGSAYVFTRSGAIWTQQQRLTASGGRAADFFGVSAAIFGNTARSSAHIFQTQMVGLIFSRGAALRGPSAKN
jgi:hypothetical protein